MIYLRIALFLVASALAMGARAQISFLAANSAAATFLTIGYGGSSAAPAVVSGCPATMSPALPAGTVAGDMLIAVISSRDNDAITMAGWTSLYSNVASTTHQAHVFWKIAAGADATTISKAAGAGCDVMIGSISRFTNVDPDTPFDGTVGASFQSSANVTTGTTTTTVATAMLIFTAHVADDNVSGNGGLIEAYDSVTTTGSDAAISLKYQLQAAAGVKGPLTGAMAASDPNHGVLFALRPGSVVTINVPTGTSANDVMIASIAVRPCSNTSGAACTVGLTEPAGWTLVRTVDQTTGGGTGGFGNRLFVYQRVAAAEPASYTWTISGTPVHAGAVGGIGSFIGVDTANPIVIDAGQATGSLFTHATPGIDVGTVTNTMLVATFADNSSATWTAPGGMTEFVDIPWLLVPNTLGLSLEIAFELSASSGLIAARTATQSNPPASDTGTTHLLALRPSPVRFDIISAGFALRCPAFPTSVTIIARDVAGNLLPTYANLVNITTSTAQGDWSVAAANGTLINGVANDGAATYQFVAADGGMIRLNLAMSVATTLTIRVQEASSGNGSIGTSITFVSDGYTIVNDPIQIAGRPQVLTVEHRVAPGCGLSTASGHGAANPVKVWLTLDPAHPAGATIPGGTGVATVNPLPTAEPGANNITLDFTGPGALAAGQAPLTLSTTDVGKYVVNIRDTATAIRSASAPITTRPFALVIRGNNAASNVQHATSETSGLMVDTATASTAAAGDNFTVTVAAYLWATGDDDTPADGVPDTGDNVADNGLTPRYAWDTTISASAVLPAGGTLGAFTLGGAAPTIPRASFAGGAARVTNLRYAEVGNVLIRATATNFLNSPGVNVTGDSSMDGVAGSGYVGRFRPKQFALDTSVGNVPTVANRSAAACAPVSTFTYLNEGLVLTFRLLAQNAQGGTTLNYNGVYARQDLSAGNPTVEFGLGARSGTTNLTGRITSIYQSATPAWANGVLNATGTSAVVAVVRRASPDNPDGPFAGVQFGIVPAELDSVSMNTLDLDVDNNATNDRKDLGVSTELRFGRLRLQNAVGSEKLALPIPIEVQYWNGAGFATNTIDSCTSLSRSTIVLGGYTGAINPGAGNCKTFVQQNPISFAAGVGALTLTAPAGAVNGTLLLTPNVGTVPAGLYCINAASVPVAAAAAAMSYLFGRWNDAADPDANANTAYDDNPSSRAAFGLFGSQPNNFIYFRENF